MIDDKKPKLPPPLPGKPRAGMPPGAPRPPAPPLRPAAPPPAAPPRPGAGPVPARPPLTPPAQAAPLFSPDVENLKQRMEAQINELQQQLSGEKEKQLLARVREKEEEAMSAKVEESLKDIQERLRREKRDQELQEQLTKTEQQMKEMEQRLTMERQTWVEALRTQISKTEDQDRDLERQFEIQMREIEKRWHEEKLGWSQTLKAKEQEFSAMKNSLETALEKEKDLADKRILQLENERAALQRELHDVTVIRAEERNALQQKIETHDRDYLAVKAQQAMLVTQVRQEKEKAEQMRQVLEKFRAEHAAVSAKAEEKEKELYVIKSQFAMTQVKTKGEQERMEREATQFREHMQKLEQDWELKLRDKQQQLIALAEKAKSREEALHAAAAEKDRKAQEAAAEIGRMAQREHAGELRIAHLEQEIKELKNRLASDKSDNDGLRAAVKEKDQRLQGLAGELNGLRQKERDAALQSAAQKVENDNLRASLKEKESRLQEAAAELNGLREKNHNAVISITRYEQAAKDLNAEIAAHKAENGQLQSVVAEQEQKIQRIVAEIATLYQKERDNAPVIAAHKAENARLLAALKEKEQAVQEVAAEVNLMRQKDRDAVLRLTHYEQETRELAGQIAAHRADIDGLRAGLAEKEKELKASREKTEQERQQAAAQIEAASAEHARIIGEKEAVIDALKHAEESAKSTIHALTAEIDHFGLKNKELSDLVRRQADELAEREGLEVKLRQREREIDKINTDYLLKAKDDQMQWAQKEAQAHFDISQLKEKLTALEGDILEKNQECGELISRHQQQAREKDTLLRELQQARQDMEEIRQINEREAAQMLAARAVFEQDLKKEYDQRYVSMVNQLKKEKDEAAALVAGELEKLKASVKQELAAAEAHYARERSQWQADAAARSAREQDLKQKLALLEQQAARRDRRADDIPVATPPLVEPRQESADYAALRQELSRVAQESDELKKALERKMAPPGPAPLPESNGTICRLWKKLNEPVIEIDMN